MSPFKLQNSASKTPPRLLIGSGLKRSHFRDQTILKKTCQKNLLRENYYLMIKRLMAGLGVLWHFLTFLKPQKVLPHKKIP